MSGQRYRTLALVRLACIGLVGFVSLHAWSHSLWTRRNEPGSWTVVLYHCDEAQLSEGDVLQDAGPNPGLDLAIHALDGHPLESVDSKAWYLDQAIAAYSPHQLLAQQTTEHPVGEMSIEVWMKVLSVGADIQIGFVGGVSMRIRMSDDGDRFHLLGANSDGLDDASYSAPGFDQFPRFPVWNHFGITISAPNVEETDHETYRYGEGCVARFFFNSHAVGFSGHRTVNLNGLEFFPQSTPAVLIHEGGLILDELQISDVDWTDPYGHEGSGHGSEDVEHAFENGRGPVSVLDWCLR